MGDISATLNTTCLDTYDPSVKHWEKSIPCPAERGGTDAHETGTGTRENDKFTIASCQFAMHYMFQDSARAHHFFRQVSSNLRLHGVLIATTVDARVVADAAVRVDSEFDSSGSSQQQRSEYKKDLSIYADDIEGSGDDTEVQKISCPLVMNIHFDDHNWNRLLNTPESLPPNSDDKNMNNSKNDRSEGDPFGIRYVFTLVDDPSKGNAVDAPEWLVPTGEPLRALAAAHGLEIDLCQNFHDFVYDKMNTDVAMRCGCVCAVPCWGLRFVLLFIVTMCQCV